MNACCNTLADLLSGAIKQRQRFGRLLKRFDSPCYHFSFSYHAVVLLDEQLIFERAILDELNRLSSGRGVVVQGRKQIQANLFFCSDLCHVLPLIDIKNPAEAR
ncbi:Uncharacterised protein [Klebsiella quasipneumoniae]|nr:Uncharacterised protein [Klebsiella quasipneumoniae]